MSENSTPAPPDNSNPPESSDQPDSPKPPEDYSHFYEAYADYAKTLRTWLVGYGIGGPVIFITNEQASTRIAASGQGVTIATLFLTGVAFQVFISLVNKWMNWYVYATPPGDRSGGLFKTVDRVTNQFWIDVVCDIGSVVMFACATIKTVAVFT